MRASRVVVFLLMVAVVIPAFADDPPVQTTRDDKGVWFIEGGSLYDVFEAMGYAVATDRLYQMDLYRRQGRGTLSELFGAELLGSNFINTDMFLRNWLYSEEELTALFNELDEDAQTVVQAYVDGVNRRTFEIYDNFYLMPYEYWIGSFVTSFMYDLGYNILPEPWTVEDAIGWLALLQRQFDPEGRAALGQVDNYVMFQTWAQVYPDEFMAMFADVRWLNDPAAQTMIPSEPKLAYVDPEELAAVDVDAYPDMRAAAERLRSSFEESAATIEEIGANVKMGSYAWTVSGDKTASGNPTIYSGPQMGFELPSIVCEGSIRGGGLDISGMTVPGIPAIIIGRTPHHAWSMQVGHAHTLDWFLEAPQTVAFHRFETINPAGGDPVTIPIFRSAHGPIMEPFPYNPDDPPAVILSYAYSHLGREAKSIEAFLGLARATSIDAFDEAIEEIAVSQHFTYADRDGNIAYWMSGWDPIRAAGTDPRLPMIGDGTQEWTGERRERAHDSNNARGFYGGWNNKAEAGYDNGTQGTYYGAFHRAHVIDEYLSTHDDLTYEEIRDLALNIATTDSFGSGGNTWSFVADDFTAAVAANSSPDRDAAIAMLDAWDGHFVAGGPDAWRFGPDRADAWVFQDAWIKEVLRLTFEDEFAASGMDWSSQAKHMLFNVLIRALQGAEAPLPTYYDWFQDKLASGKPTDAEGLIVLALDNTIAAMGLGPYGAERGTIVYGHELLSKLDPLLGTNFGSIHSMPFSSRSTYAHVLEYGADGPLRIESMFPLGESGGFYYQGSFVPIIDPNFFSMAPVYDPFMPRPFPLFD
ncbi:MAG: penicillin acylase family protein [Acidobacteriota bacterium]